MNTANLFGGKMRDLQRIGQVVAGHKPWIRWIFYLRRDLPVFPFRQAKGSLEAEHQIVFFVEISPNL